MSPLNVQADKRKYKKPFKSIQYFMIMVRLRALFRWKGTKGSGRSKNNFNDSIFHILAN